MPEFITLIVTITTILVILVFSFIFLKKSKYKNNSAEIDLSALEDRVMELVSKFQHISATRLSSLENKINEMNKLMRDANETYLKLSSILSDATKIITELEKTKYEMSFIERENKNKVDENSEFKKNQSSGELQKNPTYKKTTVENHVESTDEKSVNFFSDSVPAKTMDDIVEVTNPKKTVQEGQTTEEGVEKPFDLKSSSLEHKILYLSSEGLDSSSIAKELGVGKGEVDLVLGLFKRKFI